MRTLIAALNTPEREGLLFTLRDLVVLILVVIVVIWLVSRLRQK
jgi:flagellar biogenesis protein FliO